MKEQYQLYISIMKAFVQQKGIELPEQKDWDNVMRLAKINGTTGIVGYVLMTNPGIADPELHAFGRRACMQELAIYASRAEQMRVLIEKFNQKSIDHLLFKGYIVRNYYPVPELRTFGDIDFVIRKEDRARCDTLMKEMGYEPHTDWEPVFSYTKGMEYYEIHTDVMEIDVSDKADFKGYFSHIWENTVHTENNSFEFTPEYHLIYLLTHIAKHINSSGAGIRMYLDIAFFLKHFGDTLDWEYIRQQFAILKFEDFANITFTAVEQWFGVKAPIELRDIPEEIKDSFLEFTLEGGVFGKAARDPGLTYLKNEDRSSETVSRTATIMKRLFPKAANLEKRYTYLKGRHWLLPVAWIHRLFITKGKIRYHAQQAQSIMQTDDEEVLKLRRLYKEIGL
ncbi:MAG: nucleotidyltransferase family protein [Lachnospiraceae bacterium]|nr:nucleotidyltransferase family protein [Lachnospiraceae bacterium]